MSLSPDQLKAISRAQRSAVRNCFPRLRSHWQFQRWLSQHNRYREKCIANIDSEFKSADQNRQANNAPKSQLNQYWMPSHRQLSDYIAASTLAHCADGWTYLGQAISAEFAGKPEISTHLGYYAELRAAMSILAGEGIGIFNNHHVSVVSRGKCELIPMGSGNINGTHQFTWEVLKEWASGSAGPDLLGHVITPGRVPLSEWMRQYPLSGRSLATSWLTQWGLDLSRMANDHKARNQASYRPTAFTSPGSSSVLETLQAICAFWNICRPGAFGGFPHLDRHLLRSAIERTYNDAFGHAGQNAQSYSNNTMYISNIDHMLNSISLVEGSRQQWRSFLEFIDDPNVPRLLRDAAATSGPEDTKHSHHVMARAMLLLRLATGSVADLLRDVVSPGIPELEFSWLYNPANSRLWPKENPPQSFPELWTEVQIATDSITAWVGQSQQASRYELWQEQSEAITALATTERIGLWGLGL